jgi:hypothetical protein
MTDLFSYWWTHTLRRCPVAIFIVIAVMVAPMLTACQSLPRGDANQAKAVAGKLGGGLLVVRLLNRTVTPRAVILDVALNGQQETTAISGRLQQSIPGKFSDYLMPLALPSGSYVLRSLRSAEVPASDPAATFAELDMPLVFAQGDPVYLGRVMVRSKEGLASRQDLSIEDKFDEDTLAFRATVPELRKGVIGRRILDAKLISSVKTIAPAGGGGSMEVALIDLQSAAQLAAPARAAFGRYMQTPLPRAFATNDYGAYGYSSGRLAVDNALKNCIKHAKASSTGRSADTSCQLFSVDQTLMTADSCKAGTEDGSGTPQLRPGCATIVRKKP